MSRKRHCLFFSWWREERDLLPDLSLLSVLVVTVHIACAFNVQSACLKGINKESSLRKLSRQHTD